MEDNIGLTNEEMQELVAALSTQPNIEKAIVYGSRAMGTNRKFSDVDMTLVGKNLSHSDLNQVALKIDDLLLPYEFEPVTVFLPDQQESIRAYKEGWQSDIRSINHWNMKEES